MGIMITFSHDEIQREIAYALICETMESSRWNTEYRRRKFNETFTPEERKEISYFKRLAHLWYLVKGVPETVTMKYKTYLLWIRLGAFCMDL